VSHGEVGGLALGDGVEDDGGEVGHEVRRLAAQGRQVPHRFPPYGPTPTRSAAAKFGRRSSAPGASGAALGWVGEPEKAEPASGGVASRGDERIWTFVRWWVSIGYLDPFSFSVTSWRCPRRLAGSDAGSSTPCAGEAGRRHVG
jgi:hypothetical protein